MDYYIDIKGPSSFYGQNMDDLIKDVINSINDRLGTSCDWNGVVLTSLDSSTAYITDWKISIRFPTRVDMFQARTILYVDLIEEAE
ncbi:hypothetical protein [Sphingobium chungangianum]